MARLFIAAVLPPDVLDLLESLPRHDVDGVRWTAREQWHVTLRFLGAVDEVGAVVDALRSLPVAGVDAVLGPQVSRFGQRVLHVPVAGLDAVAGEVVRATAALGKPPEDRAFTGHVTLARARGRRRVDLRPLAGGEIWASFPVREVCLFESRLHPRGARYEVVERFPLS